MILLYKLVCVEPFTSQRLARLFSSRVTSSQPPKLHEWNALKRADAFLAIIDTEGAQDRQKIQLSTLKICACGAFATALCDIALYPIDCIKTVQQASSASLTPVTFVNVYRSILSSQGIKGFYQGAVLFTVCDSLSGAVKFGVYESMKAYAERIFPIKYKNFVPYFCAAVAFMVCSVLLLPGEVLKCRLQAGKAIGAIDGIAHILKESGIRGFYIGFISTLMRDLPYTVIELGLYEQIKLLFRKSIARKTHTNKRTHDASSISARRLDLLAAAGTGIITGFITTPLDVIKTKVMTSSLSSPITIPIAIVQTYSSGGIKALFSGCSTRVAWLLPFTTLYLGSYEWLKKKTMHREHEL